MTARPGHRAENEKACHTAELVEALEGVRKAAKEKKREKFTALLRHVTVEALEQAFRELRKDGAPGIDGGTW